MRNLFLLILLLPFIAQAQSKNIIISPGLKATILHTESSGEVKVLMAGMDTMSMELTESSRPARVLKAADYNYDGYKDFSVSAADEGQGVYFVFDIFLYHPESHSYEPLETPDGGQCDVLANVKLRAAEKGISSSCRGGAKWHTDIYQWSTPFTLTFLKSSGTDLEAEPAEPKEPKEPREPRKKKGDDDDDSEE